MSVYDSRYIRKELESFFFIIREKMPKQMQIAYTLRKVCGMKYNEISEILGCEKATVGRYIHDAKKILYIEGDNGNFNMAILPDTNFDK